jgi:hypothetical protein
LESLFTPVLTTYIKASDNHSRRRHNAGANSVCSRRRRVIDDIPIGAALSRDIGAGEKVEAELDAFISRAHDQRVKAEGERDEEAAWRESERRHNARRREANRQAWQHSTTRARSCATGASWSP